MAEKKRHTGRWLLLLLHLTGFALLYFVVRDMEWDRFLEVLGAFPAWKYAAGLLILGTVYSTKALRWKLLNRSFGIQVPWRTVLVYYLSAGFLSVITPGRLGEFAKILFLHRNYRVDIASATSSVILDRIWDVLVLSLFAALSIALLFVSPGSGWIPLLAAGLVFLLALAVVLLPALVFRPLLFLVRRFPKTGDTLEQACALWSSRRFRHFFSSLAISTFAFLLLAFVPVLFSAGTGYGVPFSSGLSAISISNILSFLPVTFAGFGTRELVFAEIWKLEGHAKEIAISVSTAYFMVTYMGSLLIGGLVYAWNIRKLYRPKEIREVWS